jgi:hypothetical protein
MNDAEILDFVLTNQITIGQFGGSISTEAGIENSR